MAQKTVKKSPPKTPKSKPSSAPKVVPRPWRKRGIVVAVVIIGLAIIIATQRIMPKSIPSLSNGYSEESIHPPPHLPSPESDLTNGYSEESIQPPPHLPSPESDLTNGYSEESIQSPPHLPSPESDLTNGYSEESIQSPPHLPSPESDLTNGSNQDLSDILERDFQSLSRTIIDRLEDLIRQTPSPTPPVAAMPTTNRNSLAVTALFEIIRATHTGQPWREAFIILSASITPDQDHMRQHLNTLNLYADTGVRAPTDLQNSFYANTVTVEPESQNWWEHFIKITKRPPPPDWWPEANILVQSSQWGAALRLMEKHEPDPNTRLWMKEAQTKLDVEQALEYLSRAIAGSLEAKSS